jgi:hypothetical protein
MRISPLALTIVIALLTGAAAIAVWAAVADNFNSTGTTLLNNSTAIELTDFIAMGRLMPIPPNGWVVNNSTGDIVLDDPESFSYAKNDYIRPGSNATASVVIYDSGGADILWNSIFKTGFIYDNNEGYARAYKYKGMPAWETGKYSGQENDYSLYIRLDDRYGVAILLKNASDSSPVKEFADRVNIYKVIAIK